MKRYISLLAASILIAGMTACTEDGLKTFGEDRYVHFTKSSDYEYRFSFATTPGQNEYTLEIPVSMIGRTLESDLQYKLEIVSSGDARTTASAATYSVPTEPVFHKELFEDVLTVILKNGAELSTEKELVLQIVANDNFKAGPVNNRIAHIYFSNVLSKPAWWDADMESSFLGAYSDIKYQTFIVATGLSDISELSAEEFKANMALFVYYLRDMDAKGTPVYESDGISKVIASVPYAKIV